MRLIPSKLSTLFRGQAPTMWPISGRCRRNERYECSDAVPRRCLRAAQTSSDHDWVALSIQELLKYIAKLDGLADKLDNANLPPELEERLPRNVISAVRPFWTTKMMLDGKSHMRSRQPFFQHVSSFHSWLSHWSHFLVETCTSSAAAKRSMQRFSRYVDMRFE